MSTTRASFFTRVVISATVVGAALPILAACDSDTASRPQITPVQSQTSSTGSAPIAKTALCTSNHVSATVGEGPPPVVAGSGHSITLTNNGSDACELTGWIGLSYAVGADGPTIGAPAADDHSTTYKHPTLTVEPGDSVIVPFSEGRSLLASDPACTPVTSTGYQVLLPGSTMPIFINTTGDTGMPECSNPKLVQLTVSAVQRNL